MKKIHTLFLIVLFMGFILVYLIGCNKAETVEEPNDTIIAPCSGITSFEYDGKIYNTVEIGDQCWMKENLNIGNTIGSSVEMTDNGIIEKYCYGDDSANCDTYGGIYKWNEMMQYTTAQGAQGICPPDWHLPTDEEWKILEGTVDSSYPIGDPEWDGSEFRGFDAGLNLKSTNGWYSNGNGADEFGFTALPGGAWLSVGFFYNLGWECLFWSATEHNMDGACIRSLFCDDDKVKRNDYGNKELGLSVRCLKD